MVSHSIRLSHSARRDTERLPELESLMAGQTHRERGERVSYRLSSAAIVRCVFRCLRRIPRLTKRRAAKLLVVIWLCWVMAAGTEWRAQSSQQTVRKQVVNFLRETNFYLVEEGQLSQGWQSPLQRRLGSTEFVTEPTNDLHSTSSRDKQPRSADGRFLQAEQIHNAVVDEGGHAPTETVQPFDRQRAGGKHASTDGRNRTQSTFNEWGRALHPIGTGSGSRGEQLAKERSSYSERDSETRDVCPLIYSVDAHTAKQHGLHLFQEELELLGTVTARLCRCLCHFPASEHDLEQHQGPRLRRTATAAAGDDDENTDSDLVSSTPQKGELSPWQSSRLRHPALHFEQRHASGQIEEELRMDGGRSQRRLGVCKGEEHARILEEMLKGANVVIAGDSGWFYRWFAGMQDAYSRTCSHFSTRSTMGIPEGTVLRTVLTGTNMYEDSWFQLEGAAWRPFRHPLDAVRHAFNFMQYKLRHSQVGPLGKSVHTDLQPVIATFDGCVSRNEDPQDERVLLGKRDRRALLVPMEYTK